MRFEIKRKDWMGRIGKLKIGNKSIETPCLFPVVDPRNNVLEIKKMKKMGVKAFITNSYIIYKDSLIREKCLEIGIHKFFGFDGIIMTDSGAYQLMRYGWIDIDNIEIVEFQKEIGSDIGVPLDYPTTPDLSRKEIVSRIKITERNCYEALKYSSEDFVLVYPVHSHYKDLVKKTTEFGKKIGYSYFGFGGIVPELVKYYYSRALDCFKAMRKVLPWNPVHVFGLGHPISFSIFVLLGADTFDSASYALFAKDDRVILPWGTRKLNELDYLPVSHPYWQDYKPKEILSLPKHEREKILAEINLYECLLEVERIKEAIREGRLFEYVSQRVRSNPYLLDSLRKIISDRFFENVVQITRQKAFLYQGFESFFRPEIKRHFKRILKFVPFSREIILLSDTDDRPYTSHPFYQKILDLLHKDVQIAFLSNVFGIIPNEIKNCYPLSQNLYPTRIEPSILKIILKLVKKFLEKFEKVYFYCPRKISDRFGREIKNPSIWIKDKIKCEVIEKEEELISLLESFDDLSEREFRKREIIRSFEYQNDCRIDEEIFENCFFDVSRTGMTRKVLKRGKIYCTIRASDFFIIPRKEMAEEVKKFFEFPRKRVVVIEDAIEYILRSKNLLAPGLKFVDEKIRPGEFVFVVDENDNLIAPGIAVLSGIEMKEAKKGVVVELR